MGANSKIEWTTHTFNPWRGCTKVSAGCAHCYAETRSKRNLTVLGQWGPNGTRVVSSEAMWREPLKWNKAAADAMLTWEVERWGNTALAKPERPRVFCASLADVFEGPETMPANAVETVAMARVRLFNLILNTPHLEWLLLTKRPENLNNKQLLMWAGTRWPELLKNVRLGASVEDQKNANRRIPELVRAPSPLSPFLSMEPLLGPMDLSMWIGPAVRCGCGGLCDSVTACPMAGSWRPPFGWAIVGGESGSGARPMHPDWARSLRDQCRSAGVAFHFKQWGEHLHTHPSELHLSPGPMVEFQGLQLQRVGKKAAGRLLDGRTWDELPEVRS